jgi:hypothetical protein
MLSEIWNGFHMMMKEVWLIRYILELWILSPLIWLCAGNDCVHKYNSTVRTSRFHKGRKYFV